MSNDQQPQGLTKTVTNPVSNRGSYLVDFDIKEDDGIATASHLALIMNDGVARTDIDIIFNPALLRTRFDSVHVEAVTSTAANLNIYTLLMLPLALKIMTWSALSCQRVSSQSMYSNRC